MPIGPTSAVNDKNKRSIEDRFADLLAQAEAAPSEPLVAIDTSDDLHAGKPVLSPEQEAAAAFQNLFRKTLANILFGHVTSLGEDPSVAPRAWLTETAFRALKSKSKDMRAAAIACYAECAFSPRHEHFQKEIALFCNMTKTTTQAAPLAPALENLVSSSLRWYKFMPPEKKRLMARGFADTAQCLTEVAPAITVQLADRLTAEVSLFGSPGSLGPIGRTARMIRKMGKTSRKSLG